MESPVSPMAQPTEGVIQFRAEHRTMALDRETYATLARALLVWRERLYAADLIGRHPERYDGAGFGNVSVRVPGRGEERPFLVTATQTGGKAELGLSDLCVIESWDPRENSVVSFGPQMPSSESMTHGAMYGLERRIRFVFHGHSPDIWRRADELGLPTTHPDIGYGTPEMASEVVHLLRQNPGARILAMGGHQDGIIAFGESAHEAGTHLLAIQRESRR